MDIRPVRSDENHRRALAEIRSAVGRARGHRQRRQTRCAPVPIDELGHTQTEFGELLGSWSRASEVLSRRRALAVEMIHKIAEAWKIPSDLLVRPYKIEQAA